MGCNIAQIDCRKRAKIFCITCIISRQYDWIAGQLQNIWKWCAHCSPQFLQHRPLTVSPVCTHFNLVVMKYLTRFCQQKTLKRPELVELVEVDCTEHLFNHSSSVVTVPDSFSHFNLTLSVECFLLDRIREYSFETSFLLSLFLYMSINMSIKLVSHSSVGFISSLK